MQNRKTKVMVGMSGGVDSSVAALLLKEQGYDVLGVFMQNWEADKDDPDCSAEQDLTDARSVCDKLQIPLQTVNFSKNYWDKVFQYFLDEYAAGRTPNPDILCNKEIKFKAFLDYALAEGADFIATGHYVRREENDGSQVLLKGVDENKDQSYFLYTLDQRQLAHSLFPIGDYQKPDVRELAKKQGFINHKKKDSTGICFIGERKFKDFLSEYLLAQPGDVLTTMGERIGRHDGLMFHTLGQRKGLGIGGSKNAKEAPWYVVEKNIASNTLIVAQEHDHPKLLSGSLQANQLHWTSEHAPNLPFRCHAKTRYRQQEQPCIITKIVDGVASVTFDKPQWAVTPGQSVVFYDENICLGGGIIT